MVLYRWPKTSPFPDIGPYVAFSLLDTNGVTPIQGTITPKFTATGTMEYTTDGVTWTTTTSGTPIQSSSKGKLFIRGKFSSNSLYSNNLENSWLTSAPKIKIIGDLMNLLNYETPPNTLGSFCFMWMFKNWSSLIEAPKLPTINLGTYCYFSMFEGCTSLAKAPELPATILKEACYSGMFYGCSSLKEVSIASTENSLPSYSVSDFLTGVASTGTLYAGNTSYPLTPSGWARRTWAERPY
jgi:hypothetical protein